MKIIAREELTHIPCDKIFSFNGNETFCHATGYEALIDDLGDDEPSWWNEYVSPDGTREYGRQEDAKCIHLRKFQNQ